MKKLPRVPEQKSQQPHRTGRRGQSLSSRQIAVDSRRVEEQSATLKLIHYQASSGEARAHNLTSSQNTLTASLLHSSRSKNPLDLPGEFNKDARQLFDCALDAWFD